MRLQRPIGLAVMLFFMVEIAILGLSVLAVGSPALHFATYKQTNYPSGANYRMVSCNILLEVMADVRYKVPDISNTGGDDEPIEGQEAYAAQLFTNAYDSEGEVQEYRCFEIEPLSIPILYLVGSSKLTDANSHLALVKEFGDNVRVQRIVDGRSVTDFEKDPDGWAQWCYTIYDEETRLCIEKRYYNEVNGKLELALDAVFYYDHDIHDRPVHVLSKTYEPDGNVLWLTVITYDEYGRKLEEKIYSDDGVTLYRHNRYLPDGTIVPDGSG